MPNVRVICLLLAALASSTACTRTVSSGSYGPLEIGEYKESVYDKVKALDVGYVEPRPRETVQINNPTLRSLRKLDPYDGILVWIRKEPLPIRIEFERGRLARTWPELEFDHHTSPSLQEFLAIASQFRTAIPVGASREHVYRAIVELAANHSVTVGNFVVGEEKFRTNPALIWTEEYRAFLLKADVWEFEGLKELVWYPAYYSRLQLSFEDGQLARIKHRAFPFELF